MKVKADTGGHLSKKLWTSIELRWLCKEDVALIKALLKECQFAGQTNILQERWLGEFVPLYRSKDLGAKRRVFFLLGTLFFSQSCASCSGSLGLVGGGEQIRTCPGCQVTSCRISPQERYASAMLVEQLGGQKFDKTKLPWFKEYNDSQETMAVARTTKATKTTVILLVF